ncbi:MAG: UDP-N-acetylglucosamine 2-epimerase [Phycisphaerae bacterium]
MIGRKRASKLRRIAVVTGTRAEYGLLHSPMKAIAATSGLKLQLVVAGMHWLGKFGNTYRQILADGFTIDARVRMQAGNDSPADQARGLAKGIRGIADFITARRTDIVLVLGDRIEAMAGAMAAVTTGKILAHIHGGDIAEGDFDDSLRHAITKLAHAHLVASKDAGRRVRRMGESAERIFVVGAPGLDRLGELMRTRRTSRFGGVGGAKTALVMFHATGRARAVERLTMMTILRAVRHADLEPTIIYPNSDRGHEGVLDAIRCFAQRHPSVTVVRSLKRDAFLERLIAADVLVGNSSCGIIEAPASSTPSVNVGPRQFGRLVGGASVIHAEATEESIRYAIRQALSKRPIKSRSHRYGDGMAGKRIAGILRTLDLDDSFRRKRIEY